MYLEGANNQLEIRPKKIPAQFCYLQRKKSKDESDVNKYSLRKRATTNYMDLEVPDDDSYLCKIYMGLVVRKQGFVA